MLHEKRCDNDIREMMHSETNHINDSGTTPWGAWATVGWGVIILIALFVFQGFVYLGFAAVEAVRNPDLSFDEMVKNILVINKKLLKII